MEDRTQEFLKACKDAGYERVTIYIKDERVPQTMKIKDGRWFGKWFIDDKGERKELMTHKVVCGFPERIGEHPTLLGNGWPLMWSIVKQFFQNSYGGGCGDAHDIHPSLVGMLKAGYYDLAELN